MKANTLKWVSNLVVGSEVYIRCLRSDSGCSMASVDHPDHALQPLVKCRIAQVDVCGVKDLYGLVWADTGKPVGLPIHPWNLLDMHGDLRTFPVAA